MSRNKGSKEERKMSGLDKTEIDFSSVPKRLLRAGRGVLFPTLSLKPCVAPLPTPSCGIPLVLDALLGIFTVTCQSGAQSFFSLVKTQPCLPAFFIPPFLLPPPFLPSVLTPCPRVPSFFLQSLMRS